MSQWKRTKNLLLYRTGLTLIAVLRQVWEKQNIFMAYYNAAGTNQERYCNRRTLGQTFIDGLNLYQEYVHESYVEESGVGSIV